MYIPDPSCFFESGFILFHNVDSLLLNEKSLRLQGFSRACACMEYRSGGVSVTLQFLGLQHPTGQNLQGYPRETPWGCLNFWGKKTRGFENEDFAKHILLLSKMLHILAFRPNAHPSHMSALPFQKCSIASGLEAKSWLPGYSLEV